LQDIELARISQRVCEPFHNPLAVGQLIGTALTSASRALRGHRQLVDVSVVAHQRFFGYSA
jgi:hypothetical protein